MGLQHSFYWSFSNQRSIPRAARKRGGRLYTVATGWLSHAIAQWLINFKEVVLRFLCCFQFIGIKTSLTNRDTSI